MTKVLVHKLVEALESEHCVAAAHLVTEANADCSICNLIQEARDWLKVEEPKLGPLAIVCDGGLVQSVNSDDPRLIHNIRILVIDYDTDGADTVYYVPQVDKQDPTAESDAQLHEEVCNAAIGIDLTETWRRYMDNEVTLDCATISAATAGYKVRVVPNSRDMPDGYSTNRWEWYTDEAVSFVDYEDADAAWLAAYQDLVQ